MRFKSIIKIVSICLFLGFTSCQEDIDTSGLMQKLQKLPQNEIAEKRIQKLKSLGIEATLEYELARSPLFSKDRSDGIHLYYIKEDLDSIKNILFTVRYNVKTNEVVSVESNPKLIKE
jgi:hypothetical protein